MKFKLFDLDSDYLLSSCIGNDTTGMSKAKPRPSQDTPTTTGAPMVTPMPITIDRSKSPS